jgi:uncharacterized protein
MKTRILDFNAELKAVGGETGEFEGYGSVFNVVDSYSEVVDKGAFVESLKKFGMPALLWQHRSSEPCGIYTACYEDEKGLYVKGQLNLDTQVGHEAYALLKQGALKGLSIGFNTEDEWQDTANKVTHLRRVRLFEVSLVTFPANAAANVEAVKSMPETVRQFEDFLRDAGYSRNDAALIASKGFNALMTRREGGDLGLAVVTLEGVLTQLKKATSHVRHGENRQAG